MTCSGSIDATVASATRGLRELCASAGIDESHGATHALTVLGHVDKALAVASTPLSEDRILAVRLAALLHDADGKKYFATYATFANACGIMAKAGTGPAVVEDAAVMIGWVSCSANGNACPPAAAKEPELLWPRWADRLEAAGEIGVARCYLYTNHDGKALALPSTSLRRSTSV